MGFLTVNGMLMTYDEYKHLQQLYKMHGLLQFVKLYSIHKDRQIDAKDLHWGEEIEYHMYAFDDQKQEVKLACDGDDLIKEFNGASEQLSSFDSEMTGPVEETEIKPDFKLLPEFGNWMIEAVPIDPYGAYSDPSQLLICKDKITARRQFLNQFLSKRQKTTLITTSASPILGIQNSMTSSDEDIKSSIDADYIMGLDAANKLTHQRFIPEKTASPHPRFLGLAKSIYERRREKVDIQVPRFQDVNTNMEKATEREPIAGQIYMDAMHFGMGASCLQITYETQNVSHARFLYDMFLPFTPIMSAISASTPLLKGQISDHDLRWEVIEQAVDCRTRSERDPNSEEFIPKSRYSTASNYLSNHEYIKDFHNDLKGQKHSEEALQMLIDNGLDKRLAYHISTLFIRAPIPVYAKELMFPCCQNKCLEQEPAKVDEKSAEEIKDENLATSKEEAKETPKKVAKASFEGTETDKQLLSEENANESQSKANLDFETSKLQVNKQGLSNSKTNNNTEFSDQLSITSCCSLCDAKCEIKAGVCTKWWTKCPPIDGNSHFENLQSTNWNSLRFKNPPTEDSDIGWRVEFRPMDIQLTDFENAALTIMTGMIANIVNTFDLDFIVPISLIDENMKRAHIRDGITQVKFWWKVPEADTTGKPTGLSNLESTQFLKSNADRDAKQNNIRQNDEAHRYKELFIWQILEGDASVGMSTGIISLCQQYMALKKWSADKITETMQYLTFLAKRARGEIPTGARFLRDFVLNHPDYKKDSFLTPQMQFDLLKMLETLDGPTNEAKSLLLKEFA